ncbi:hypothetical protein HJC23_011745 [Cyclotella cryptica]|uniref:Uncharacterized protein n=1 Tax=Cyclotella cryptica TaxID=29204 RepID=A0ABD3PH82_9STRA|eukprot:CCRYP_014784-RA/>CCRYP_014784-RA protein AED:0.02 eAED:0.01 QI:0/-1/0/1/-1/1/1/0/647
MSSSIAPPPPPTQPITVHYAIGNSYTRLPTHTAPMDRTGRHAKIHDWTLYVDILPGSDPDMVERVSFDMRDDSFLGMGFTCHCPIRIRAGAPSPAPRPPASSEEGRAVRNNRCGQSTQEPTKSIPSHARPHPNASRWRFSTRQQTYGPVDVRITIRGIGGSKSVVDYKIVLDSRSNDADTRNREVYGEFVERRPNSKLKPIKMMDGGFGVHLCYGFQDDSHNIHGIDNSRTSSEQQQQSIIAENRMLLQQIAKSIYSRSKRPMRAELHNRCNGESWTEEWFGNTKSQTDDRSSGNDDNTWTLKFVQSSVDDEKDFGAVQIASSRDAKSSHDPRPKTIISISSPNLTGGNGLNECYKIIEGLPPCLSCTYQTPHSTTTSSMTYNPQTQQQHSFHVQINVSNLSLPQIIKVCQNYIKYEDAIDSFMPWHRREDRSHDCRSNKRAMSEKPQQELTNKQRNVMIGKCTSFQDLVSCLNPVEGQCYKLNLQHLSLPTTLHHTNNSTTPRSRTMEFRQHPSSKDKTTITHWIRFCMAFVNNSARLRPPMALKNTTSLEEEFDLLFEYVVKDRALRNFYRERRDEYENNGQDEFAMALGADVSLMLKKNSSDDSMSISDGGSDGDELDQQSCRKRVLKLDDVVDDDFNSKRHCS